MTGEDVVIIAERVDQVRATSMLTFALPDYLTAVDVARAARSDVLARIGDGDWDFKVDVDVDHTNQCWVACVTAKAPLPRGGV